MSQWRKDPLLDRWVIVAENRAARPNAFVARAADTANADACPFCRGNEEQTPPAVAVYPASDDGDWQVRVVPNKYPALGASDVADDHACALDVRDGRGVHEVIIESPNHVVSLAELTEDQVDLTFQAYLDRLQRLREGDGGLAFAQVFKNARAAAGASIEHCHSQLLAMDFVPPDVQLEVARAGEYRAMHRSCAYCDLLVDELRDGARIVAETDDFVALCPFASRFAYETWIVPREHATSCVELSDGQRRELATLTRDLLHRLETHLHKPAYNYCLRNGPFHLSPHDDFHWRLEVTPRLAGIAGFELSSGCFINPVAPEKAASCLCEP